MITRRVASTIKRVRRLIVTRPARIVIVDNHGRLANRNATRAKTTTASAELKDADSSVSRSAPVNTRNAHNNPTFAASAACGSKFVSAEPPDTTTLRDASHAPTTIATA